VSARLKNSSKKIKNKVFSSEGYHSVPPSVKAKEATFKYKIIPDHKVNYKDEKGASHEFSDNLIITWFDKRARRDRKERKKLLD
jgi:hypothetical protein